MHDRRWKRQRLTHTLTALLLVFMIAAGSITAVFGYFRIGDEKVSKYSELVLQISRMADTRGADGDGSERAYKEAIALFPEKVAAYRERAKVLFDAGRYAECISFIRSFATVWTSYDVTEEESNLIGDIYFILAECYFDREDYTNAVQYYEMSLLNNTSNPNYYRGYAIVLARLGQISDAEGVLDELLLLKPSDDSIYLLRGEIAYATADYDAAVTWFQDALLTINDNYMRQRAYFICAKSYQRLPDRVNDEIELLTSARREFPEQLVIAEQLADAYIRAARSGGAEAAVYLEQAVELFEGILEKGLVSMRILLNIGVLYQELGSFQAARTIYINMLSDYPDSYLIPLRLTYLTLEEQSHLTNEERNYSEAYRWYIHTRELYDTRPTGAGDDAEMLMLDSLMVELHNNGWLEG